MALKEIKDVHVLSWDIGSGRDPVYFNAELVSEKDVRELGIRLAPYTGSIGPDRGSVRTEKLWGRVGLQQQGSYVLIDPEFQAYVVFTNVAAWAGTLLDKERLAIWEVAGGL